jgi:SAM-dependent methyltransferase
MTSNPHSGPPSHGDREFDGQWWEKHYQGAEARPDSPSSAQLVAEVVGLTPGTVLEAGCGTGADAVWLARQGWDVTAVDVSPTAIERARAFAEKHEPDVTKRLSWLVADLTRWQAPQHYDLVVSQYVHPDMPFGDFVSRLAEAVGPGGTLLVVGHDHADTHSAAHAPKPASIGPEAVTHALDPSQWEIDVAEARTRQVTRGAAQLEVADMVVKAHRKPSR